jgi:hypothetical protein
MKRLLFTAAALASLGLAGLPQSSWASTRVGVSINIGDPYRGGALHFRSEPDVVLVPSTRVYYVENYDYDVYRFGSYWYFIDDGRWYRARSYRGPFVYIHTTSVPRAIVQVPTRYRRHWGGPPAHAVARGYRRNQNENNWVDQRGNDNRGRGNESPARGNDDRRRGTGNGKGKGNAKGHGH